jgi:hypothetical protein
MASITKDRPRSRPGAKGQAVAFATAEALRKVKEWVDREAGPHPEKLPKMIQWDEGYIAAFMRMQGVIKRIMEEAGIVASKPAVASTCEEVDAQCERFNNAMHDLVKADKATERLNPDPPNWAARNRALEEAWAAYQASQCACAEKPSKAA